MTDEQICRKIAESLDATLLDWHKRRHRHRGIEGKESSLCQDCSATNWNQIHESSLYASEQYPDFFTDPTMRDLLVRKMVNAGWIVTITFYEKQQVYGIELSHESKDEILEGSKDYERLIPLAYLKTIPAAKEKA